MKFYIIKKINLIITLSGILCLLIFIFTISLYNTSVSVFTSPICNTNEERIEFLESYGWFVESEPYSVSNIIIPIDFDDTMNEYNSLQISQGYDLTKYSGCTVKKITYKILNYPENETAYSTIYLYQNMIIAGDVYTVGLNGIMQGFLYPL